MALLYQLFLMTVSPYSITALSAEGLKFVRTDCSPLWVMVLCIVKKKKTTSTASDKHAAAIIYDSFHSNKLVGHVPLYWSELANKFVKFPNHHNRVVGTGKRVN